MSETIASKRTGRPTLADIARVLGVSEATVSRGLRDNSEISEQTRDLIRGVARDLGYVPNAAARNLARQTSQTLGLLVPDVTDPIHGLVVAGFGRVADSRGYTVILIDGSRDEARRTRGLRTLLEHQVEGVAFCGAPIPAKETIAEIHPTFATFIMPEGPGPAGDTETPLGQIQSDEEQGIRLLVEHLLETGRQRFSYVNGPDLASNRRRRDAVIKSLEEMGVEPRIREYVTGLDRSELDRVAELVARERPDALICYDDKMALHLLDALRRHNLSVPDDVAVAGFDGIPFAAISNPRLTTVVQPAERLGELAALALFEAVESGKPPADVTAPVTLSIGSSTVRDADVLSERPVGHP